MTSSLGSGRRGGAADHFGDGGFFETVRAFTRSYRPLHREERDGAFDVDAFGDGLDVVVGGAVALGLRGRGTGVLGCLRGGV